MLNVNDITFSYGRRRPPVLDRFTLRIEHGGIYGLLGRNGAGKSTLLYLMAGLLTPQCGCVLYNGSDMRSRRPSALSDVFIVPEEFNLPPISLREYVRVNSQFYPRFSMADMRSHLSVFDLTDDINLAALSMGQKKKVFMCFALACNTGLLLLDEPTNGLDIPGKSQFRRFAVSSMTDDRIIIISTHQVADINRILDHVVIMDNSHVIYNASVGETLMRFRFGQATGAAELQGAIYRQPSPTGFDAIWPGSPMSGDETELNLETLFNLALTNPAALSGAAPAVTLP